MDTELRFISALLYANRPNQERFHNARIPKTVFTIRTQEIDWLYRFRDQHGHYPSPAIYRKRFNDDFRKVRDGLTGALEPVLDMAMFEQMRSLNEETKKAMAKGEPVKKVMERFKAKAQRLSTYSSSYVDVDMASTTGPLDRYRDIVSAYADGGSRLIDSPWPTLNKLMRYNRPGERITIAGRGNLGKSWIVCMWAHHWAMKGIRVGIFTKEMPTEEFEERMECLRYGLCYPDYIGGEIEPAELRRWRVKRALDNERKSNYPLFIFGNETEGSMGFDTLETKVKEYQLEAAWFDGGYLIRPPELPANIADTQRFTYLSNRSKELAKRHNIVLGITVQDNRSAEGKDGQAKGGATTVFGADAWFQDSDVMLHVNGKRGAPTRELAASKIRKADLVEVKVGFELDPKPNFPDLGPTDRSPAEESKPKRQVKFKKLK